jgi:hypothetical protein
VQTILRAAEHNARSPLELEKEVLGVRDFLEEVMFHCRQDPSLQLLLTARVAPTPAEQARDNTDQLKVAICDLKDMIERPTSITTLHWQDAVPLPRTSLADRLQAQSRQLEIQSGQLQRQSDLLQEQSDQLQNQCGELRKQYIQLQGHSTRLQRIEKCFVEATKAKLKLAAALACAVLVGFAIAGLYPVLAVGLANLAWPFA